jgi:hypothetical protein
LASALVGSEWAASHPSHFTHHGKSPQYPLKSRLGGLQNQYGRGDERIENENATVIVHI